MLEQNIHTQHKFESVLGSVRPVVGKRRYIVPEMVNKQRKSRERRSSGTEFQDVNHAKAVS